MDARELEEVISKIRHACLKCGVNLVVVGSVAYTKGGDMNECDDLDSVVIYDDIKKLHDFEYIDKRLYDSAVEALKEKEIDLFATKLQINGIKISLDFISINYFEKLARCIPSGNSKMLHKMTDAEECPTNDYYSFLGNQFIYTKEKYINRNLNVYILPQFLYYKNLFFSGVLYNKFIHAPHMELIINLELLELHKELISNYAKYYYSMKEELPEINILLSIRNWEKFSNNSRRFIYDSFNIKEDITI